MTATKPRRTVLFAALLAVAILSILGYRASGNGATNTGTDRPYGEAVIPPTGGGVGLPGNEVFVSVAPGTVEEPIRIR
ncbi:hypothetical protein HNQ05_002438, partial [Oceanithermus desulfurans]|nr:hypothetical protein [Oceanithermus desulfurans]